MLVEARGGGMLESQVTEDGSESEKLQEAVGIRIGDVVFQS